MSHENDPELVMLRAIRATRITVVGDVSMSRSTSTRRDALDAATHWIVYEVPGAQTEPKVGEKTLRTEGSEIVVNENETRVQRMATDSVRSPGMHEQFAQAAGYV
jgi:hypothetical protein